MGGGPVGLRYDITSTCRAAAMYHLGSDFRCFSVSGELRGSIGTFRIASTSAEPISAIVRSSSRSKPEVLRTIAEMGSALVDVIRHGPKLVPDSPDTERRQKSDLGRAWRLHSIYGR